MEKLSLSDQLALFCDYKNNGKEKCLIVTHGIGEHCGRHQYLNEVLGNQFNIFYYDLRGHGKSDGKSAWVENFEQFYDDLFEIYQHIKENFSEQKISLFGHSMGGLITAGFLQKYSSELDLEKFT